MSRIFISYRRDDSAGYAQAIHSGFIQHFSKDQIFMDVATVEPGVNFVRAIEKAVGECDVLVALIGKRWIGAESGGTSRLGNTKDYVRLEIATALARDIRVIPVLIDGMTMPNMDSLPPSIQPITQRNAIEISNTRFNFDVERLIIAVRKVLDETGGKGQADEGIERNRAQPEDQQVLNPWRTYGPASAVVVLILIGFVVMWLQQKPGNGIAEYDQSMTEPVSTLNARANLILVNLDSQIMKISRAASEAEDKRDCSKLKDQLKLASEPCEQILKKSRDVNNKLRELKAKFEELHKKHITAIENDDAVLAKQYSDRINIMFNDEYLLKIIPRGEIYYTEMFPARLR